MLIFKEDVENLINNRWRLIVNKYKLDKKKLAGIGGIIVSLASLIYIAFTINIKESLGIIFQTDWYYPVISAGLYLSSFWLRAVRWKKMLANYEGIPFKHFFDAIMLGFAGNNLLPAKGGELVRMEYFSKKTGVNRVTSFSSATIIKIIDSLTILILLLLVVWISDVPFFENNILYNLTITAGLVFIAIILLLLFIRIFGARIITKLSAKQSIGVSFFERNLEKIYASLVFLNFDRNTMNIFIIGLLIWTIESLVFIIILFAYVPEIDVISAGVITLAVVNYGLLIPSSPGFVGLFQGLTIIALGLFGVIEETALAISVVVHLAQFLPVTLLGIFIFVRHSLSLSKQN